MVQRRSVALIIVGVLLTIEGMAEATDAPDGMWRAEVVTPPGCVDTFREQLRARAPHVVFTDDAARVFRVRIAEAGDHLRGTLEVDKMGASTHREIEGSECDEVLRWFDFAKEMVFMRVRFILGALAVAASLVGCGGIVDLGSVEPGRPDARAAERREGADGADAIVTGDTSAKAEETPEGTSVGEVFGEPFVVQGGASMMFATTSPPYEAGRFFLLTPYPKACGARPGSTTSALLLGVRSASPELAGTYPIVESDTVSGEGPPPQATLAAVRVPGDVCQIDASEHAISGSIVIVRDDPLGDGTFEGSFDVTTPSGRLRGTFKLPSRCDDYESGTIMCLL